MPKKGYKQSETKAPLCKCGCGQRTKWNKNLKKFNIYLNRHHNKGKNHPMYGKPGTNLGKHFTEEHKRKIGESNKEFYKNHPGIISGKNNPMYGKGYKLKGEKNGMYGVHMKGKDAPMYGKHHTLETKEKIRNSNHHKNLRGKNNPNYGKHIPKKQKEKQIKKVKEYWNKPGIREKAKEKSKEVWERPGYKENMIKTHSGENNYGYGKHLSEETRKKISDKNKGKKRSLETRNKISKAKKELFARPENRKKASINKKEYYNNHPEAIEKIKKARTKQILPVKDTKIEVKIQTLLKQLGYDFFTHQYMKEIEHSYQCDIFIPILNLVIECDGDYWHKYPIGNDLDHIRTKELIEKGFKVLRLWGREIRALDLKGFEDIIIKMK